MADSTIFNRASVEFLEALHRDFQRDPQSVPPDWQDFFRRQAAVDGDGRGATARAEGTDDAAATRTAPSPGMPRPLESPTAAAVLQDRVDQLVRAYRVRGHMIAKIDPLELPRPEQAELDPGHYGLTEDDMDRMVSSRTIAGPPVRTLRELFQRLRNTYCRSIAVQFMHIDHIDIRHWLQERMEGTENRIQLSRRQQFRILSRLTEAVVFEEFVQKKYVGAKTFSLEGCESLIPLLDMAIERAGEHGISEIVLGMAHRGRLNVLANIMSKRPVDIFREFEDDEPDATGAGDVKYHLGHSSDWETAAGYRIHLSLCFNPSHLEYINPVALGRMRAKQDRVSDARRERGMVFLIHGDAAFAGEGIAQETLNLSELPGYSIGGTVHVLVNNQLGFTTSPPEARSSLYASGVAKMLQIPIFHVNGEDPEAVAQVVRLALDFRQTFKRDVVIDMYGYRRHGHNEMDEPSFTQPVLYRAIRERKSVREGYLDHLLQLGGITREQADEVAAGFQRSLEEGLTHARSDDYIAPSTVPGGIWSGYSGGFEPKDDVATGVEAARLSALLRRLNVVPRGFHRHPKLERLVQMREAMASGERPLDWSAAEALAFATLATEGIRVRLTGQDSGRGTFSQRHAILHDHENGTPYVPHQHLANGQAPVEFFNSPLSEAGVLGFEYGYSLDCPDGLILWEAQFGDFFNAAQVIVDQFIVSAEDKWRRLSGLVLLLPHGQEGQGPEHSSARIERFLLLSAEHNIQVAQPSTPAQLFHLLRRQVLRSWRKPLVVFTPKSLLRHPEVKSSLADLATGLFQPVLPDMGAQADLVKRILLCSGKLYYELDARRRETKRPDVAIVRLEQFYPLRENMLRDVLSEYGGKTPVVWVQEEPQNMGAWPKLCGNYRERLIGRHPFSGICRAESASPAPGSAAVHKREQAELIDRAFDIT